MATVFDFSTVELETLDALVSELNFARAVLEQAVDNYNTVLKSHADQVDSAAAEYNATLTKAREFARQVFVSAQNEISRMDDRERNSEEGQLANNFRRAWEDTLDDLDTLVVEVSRNGVFTDDINHAAILDNAPTEV